MKIVFNIKEDDARNPASSPTARATTPATPSAQRRRFRDLRRHRVALISFILLAFPRK